MKKLYYLITLLSVTLLSINLSYATVTDTIETTNNSCLNLTTNMSFGSKDSSTNGQVSELQFFLNDKGYLKTDPTGYFGPATREAVKLFQQENDITPNGLVGPITRGKIKTVSCNEDSNDEILNNNNNNNNQSNNNNSGGVTSVGSLTSLLTFSGTDASGAPVSINGSSNGTVLTNIDPLRPRTWKWSSTGAASVSGKYVISGNGCLAAGLGGTVEGLWKPWDNDTATGNRFNGQDTKTANSSYYGCDARITYSAKDTLGNIASSIVKIIFKGGNSINTGGQMECMSGSCTLTQVDPSNLSQTLGQTTQINSFLVIPTSPIIGSQFRISWGVSNAPSTSKMKIICTHNGGSVKFVDTYKPVSSSGESFNTPGTSNPVTCFGKVVNGDSNTIISGEKSISFTPQQSNQGSGSGSGGGYDSVPGTTQSNLNIPNVPGDVCAVSPTSVGSAAYQNVYTRDAQGNLTLKEECKGNKGKIAGLSSFGIQCQSLVSSNTGAKCAPEGSVFINGDPILWKGNTNGTCYADSACDNGYECKANQSGERRCTPMVQYNSDFGIEGPQGEQYQGGRYKRVWSGSVWGEWVFVSCLNGYHQESGQGNKCFSDTKSCQINNGQGIQRYNKTNNSWGVCEYETDYQGNNLCNQGYHFDYQSNSCVSSIRSCSLGNPYPTQYPRGTDVASGEQKWGWSAGTTGWQSCELKCKSGFVKRGVYADAVGISSFQLDSITTSNYLEFCAKRYVEFSVINSKDSWSNLPSVKVSVLDMKNVEGCYVSVKSNNGSVRNYDGVVRMGTNITMHYDNLNLETTGGKVELTCFSAGDPQLVLSKDYSPAVSYQTSYSCTNSVPANAFVYSGDDTNLTQNTSYTYSSTNTQSKCEYKCNSGYVWSNGFCNLDNNGGSGNQTPSPTVSISVSPSNSIIFPMTINYGLSSTNAKSCEVKVNNNNSISYGQNITNLPNFEVVATPGIYNIFASCAPDLNGGGTPKATDSKTVTVSCPVNTTWNQSSNSCIINSGSGNNTIKPTITIDTYPSSPVTYPTNISYTFGSTNAKSCEITDSNGVTHIKKSDNIAAKSITSQTTPGTLTMTGQCWSDYNGTGASSDVVTKQMVVNCPTNTTWNGSGCASQSQASCSVTLSKNSFYQTERVTANVTSSGVNSVKVSVDNGANYGTFTTNNGTQVFEPGSFPVNQDTTYSGILKGVKSDGSEITCSNSPYTFTVKK